MINYRKGKKRIKIDNLGSLYINYDKINTIERPVIYIGGQMEHRFHIIEQTGFTGDPGHNMFSGSWFYDYPIHNNNKEQYNSKNFATNLIKSLELANIGDVDLITESYGGLIGAYASQSPLIHKVIAIHPPILGTPLANRGLMKIAVKELENQQKIIAQIAQKLVDYRYGFEQENSRGIYSPNLNNTTDLSKLLVVGSSIDYETEQNNIVKKLYDIIYLLTNQPSDGVIIFDTEELSKLGINYMEEDNPTNHFAAGTQEHIENIYQKTLKKAH